MNSVAVTNLATSMSKSFSYSQQTSDSSFNQVLESNISSKSPASTAENSNAKASKK